MGVSGPKPIPFEVHVGRGTVRKDKHGTEEDQPKVSARAPRCPSILGRVGRAEWRRAMKASGTIQPQEIDLVVFTQYCLLWERLVENPKSFKASDHTQLRLCAAELGFTRTARQRLRGE